MKAIPGRLAPADAVASGSSQEIVFSRVVAEVFETSAGSFM
jgi:hypothetical protein